MIYSAKNSNNCLKKKKIYINQITNYYWFFLFSKDLRFFKFLIEW